MSDLTLAKADLPEGWISADVGEPHIVRANLYHFFDMERLSPIVKDYNQFEYTKPAGYDPLVKFLENKHQAPVIISNGAKQAIGALFYALKKLGKESIYLPFPWWSLFPPLINMHGLRHTGNYKDQGCAQLIVYPNNPSGGHSGFLDQDNLSFCLENKIPVIHDAAYYNKIYLPEVPKLGNADVQVFTCSKLLGLSQLRVGYAVYHNTQLYKDALSYMEHMTVGVSILSQIYAYNIFQAMQENPVKAKVFEELSYHNIQCNRNLAKQIPASILEPAANDTGMFLWTKCHDLSAFEKAKIKVVEGAPFGMPGYIRMNIAVPTHVMTEIVNRLNQ